MPRPNLIRESLVFALLLTMVAVGRCEQPLVLKAGVTPADNPLKGLVPYSNPPPDRFPHSMEFEYLPLSELMTGPDEFDWQPLEELLNGIAGRGNQTVFRIWMEYPGRKDGIPEFLEQEGVKVTEWLCTNTDPFPRQKVRTPDYSDSRLQAALKLFIEQMGAKYDGDPRIGFITAGLLGTWGEWHTYPRTELYPTKECQQVVMDAYEAAFPTTPVLLRYPAGDENYHYAANHNRALGYHDDSFAWATLDTGRKEDDWFYLPALKAAEAGDKWKSQPIGGEIRPELWPTLFTDQKGPDQEQDFEQCVQQTHASWLMDTGMFQAQSSDERLTRATEAVRKMGYDFQLRTVDIASTDKPHQVAIVVTLTNRGVAPFYYDWKIELGAIDESGQIVHRWPTDWTLRKLLPADADRVWSTTLDTTPLPGGTYQLALRVINPLPGGKLLKFANSNQDRHANGWVTLGELP